MRTTRLRYFGLGLLLPAVAVALLMTWRLSHVLFGIVIGFICLVVMVLALARDGWRQTSPDSLHARGFAPDAVRGGKVPEQRRRRNYTPVFPAAVSRRISGNPGPPPAAAAAAGQEPARR